ncbi:alginate lyase family protein [bacterium]|jgi:hypothetical protein|nr:alginate lyase family protein [bacterium]MBT3581964.1 alginate lyase family protein [bacterium]MBT4551683.1 alginate lyase family protein [bacterium]
MNVLEKIVRTPMPILINKLSHKLFFKFFEYRDLYFDTRISFDVEKIQKNYIDISKLDFSKIDKKVVKYLIDMYLNHRFDFLGSGWVTNSYDSKVLGLEQYRYEMNVEIERFDKEGKWLNKIILSKHLKRSKKIWQQVSENYIPIDWQKDYKSGFRWDARKWYKNQQIGDKLGSDIKVPWELARLQHLPQMAIFSLVLPNKKDQLILEFKNQILDFIATNPPRMGCNWTCAMDVGIRVANMLVAYDMFLQIDNNGILDNKFKQIFANSVYEHGVHIMSNLENGLITYNHYLANIVGLLFVVAYLEKTKIVDRWLGFAVKELIREFDKQFYEDGSNFEASTNYHRLSGELMIYGAAFVLGLEKDKAENVFPEWFWERLWRVGKFTVDLTKKTGEISQIGDNDSGRFFRFSPSGLFLTNKQAEEQYLNLEGYNKLINKPAELFWDKNILNHATFVSAIDGLFNDENFQNYSHNFPLEKSIIEALAKGKKVKIKDVKEREVKIESQGLDLEKYEYHKETVIKPSSKKKTSLDQNLVLISYSDTGIYIFKSDRIHMTISAGPNGQNGNGGHAHNDKLSFELNIDGEDLFVDPGTYLYTPLPERRNEFRSVKVHNTLVVADEEQNDFRDLFGLVKEAECIIRKISNKEIIIELNYKDVICLRKICIMEDKILVNDFANKEFKVNFVDDYLYSNGYGKFFKKRNEFEKNIICN